ncbi:hypothetical protein QT711_07410 [Sporosarcina saromensis]|uniref:Uncharacterized protein n=1 Tax=Sporosarcina saromensis TaxID=359365 RepID=A0ABU4G7Q2_9BACL|nr:hypothetical protein [Sporosarcina saromensis]MDW0113009.1 hypothetical protein [Sporosarcina saromensis]
MRKLLLVLSLLTVFTFTTVYQQAHASHDKVPEIMSIKTTSISK